MADSRFRHEVEAWIRDEHLPKKYGQMFHKGSLKLKPGGHFEFDAISEDSKILVLISSASANSRKTLKRAYGNINKIRGDLLFLTLVEAEQKVVALTEHDMFDYWSAECQRGRVSHDICFTLVELPKIIRARLDSKKAEASEEIQRVPKHPHSLR